MADTENITIIKGSFGYNLSFTLKDSAGTARNMTGYSAKLQVWEPLTPGTLLLDVACSWTDITAGTLYYTVASTNFDTIGVYCYRIKAYIGTTVIEYPLAGFLTVIQYGGNYCTLEEAKEELNITSENYDSIFQALITQAKTFIDNYCDRNFEAATATRYFDGSAAPLFIDDLITVTTFKLDEDGDGTYESTLTANTDYVLYPLNETPKTYVKVGNDSSYGGFASGIRRGVQIIGSWGYASTVPAPIRLASIIQVCRWYKRKDTAFQDVVSTPELGTYIAYKGLDSDIQLLLEPYRRKRI